MVRDDQTPRWLLRQEWRHLLFAHWQAEPAAVARLLPPGVEPDVRGDVAWVAIVAFVMVGTRSCVPPYRPALPPVPELNVRTYVRVGGVPGVWFLSLDATSPIFVHVGRALYGLRYHLAKMTTVGAGECVHYLSRRGDAAFAAAYRPDGPAERPAPGSLEHFLVERYRLFSERRGRLVTAEVAHEPWPLRPAAAEIHLNRMAPPGIDFDGAPLVHYARSVDALISAPAPLQVRRARVRAPARPRLPSRQRAHEPLRRCRGSR